MGGDRISRPRRAEIRPRRALEHCYAHCHGPGYIRLAFLFLCALVIASMLPKLSPLWRLKFDFLPSGISSNARVTSHFTNPNIQSTFDQPIADSHAHTTKLARFTAYWRSQFNITDARNVKGAVLTVTHHDLRLTRNHTEQQAYISGVPRRANVQVLVRGARVYNDLRFSKLSGYQLVRASEMDQFRHENIARLPVNCTSNVRVPWLVELRNVWMTSNGDIFHVMSPSLGVGLARTYSYGGGFCPEHWLRANNRFFKLQVKCRHRLAFALVQNHGYSYYHVMAEQIPRLLAFWEVASSTLGLNGVIVGPASGVLKTALTTFGVPAKQYQAISAREPCFFERVFLPEPFVQGRYSHECLRRASDSAMHMVFAGPRLPPLPANVSERRTLVVERGVPMVLLIERATSRQGKRCCCTRCMSNFVTLRKSIEEEFGSKIQLTVLSPRDRDLMRRTILLFRNATVVIGVHGAAFHNVAHMRGYGTYAIHLGWRSIGFYAAWARKYHVEYVNVVTPGVSQHGRNAQANVRVVISELRRALELEGFALDPPKRAVNRSQYEKLLILP